MTSRPDMSLDLAQLIPILKKLKVHFVNEYIAQTLLVEST